MEDLELLPSGTCLATLRLDIRQLVLAGRNSSVICHVRGALLNEALTLELKYKWINRRPECI